MGKVLIFFISLVFLMTLPAGAALDYSSSFDGSVVPWNWDSYAGSPSGTDQMVAPAGPSAGASYVTHNVSGVAGNGTGSLNISFDIDVLNMAFGSLLYSGPRIFEVGTIDGNKSVFGDGAMAQLDIDNWKADPGQTGQFRFSLSTFIRFWNGTIVTTPDFAPQAGQSSIYHLDLDILADEAVGDAWTITANLDVTGADRGAIVTKSIQSIATRTDSAYDGLLDIVEYHLGTLDTGNTYDGTSMVFDNFDAVPEPATMMLLGLGGLALLRRRG